jgi:hypothetical protein
MLKDLIADIMVLDSEGMRGNKAKYDQYSEQINELVV